jgi:aminoglycoside phosphotransferase family enzyme/predicted kinase
MAYLFKRLLIYIFFKGIHSLCAILVHLFSLLYIAGRISFSVPGVVMNRDMASLVEALSHPEAYPDDTGTIEVVETHISWIFLTETWAYKVKKPLNLGFLDFSTLQKRHHYCNEELRLNRRLCPELYISVVPVVSSANTFLVDADGEIVDYAVKMVRFDRDMELDRMLSGKLLKEEHIDTLSGMIAGFHTSLSAAPAESGFGHPDNLIKPIMHNFNSMEPVASNEDELQLLEFLKAWSIKEHQRLYPLFLQRKSGGFIRQCHGDMHTGNMVLWKERIFIFDCIEFNENLSIIDVISDLAFLFMDLEHGEQSGLAWRLLNHYLIETGDYSALPLLRFYLIYRAMVRAKVTAIRYSQTSSQRLAQSYTRNRKPLLIMTFGVSGSGKTMISGEIAQRINCIHLRSDIERKRIAGLRPLDRSERNGALYTEEINRQTYRRLLDLAAICIVEGITVIVDATFLKTSNRKRFLELARSKNAPCRILRFSAPEELLFKRVQKRYLTGNDASEADTAVLASQLEKQEPLTAEETVLCIDINTEKPIDKAAIAAKLQSHMH